MKIQLALLWTTEWTPAQVAVWTVEIGRDGRPKARPPN